MHPLANLKIGTKILLGYGIILVLLVIVGILGWQSVTALSTRFADLTRNNLQGAVQLANAQDALWQLRYGFPQFLVLGDADRRRIVAEQEQWYRQINANIADYKAGERTREEQQAIAAWDEIYTKYAQARPRWFELQLAGQLEEAAAWRAQTTTPYGRGSVEALEHLINLQRNVAEQKEAEATAAVAQTIASLIGFTVVALLAGLGIAFYLSRSILTPVRHLTATARAITDGNLAAVARITTRDEVGVLGAAFNQMTAMLQLQMHQVTERTDALQDALAEVEARAAEQARLLSENQQQQVTIRDLSAPVIPILPGVLIAPLIGSLDSARMAALTGNILSSVEQLSTRYLIVDITGVPVVDTQVAQVLVKTATAVRLLGARVLLVGIRPEVAQIIVTLNLDLTIMTSYSSLQQAVAAILVERKQ
jgi:anti-anti-sigma regulatory factor/HAMP domain-containing protein